MNTDYAYPTIAEGMIEPISPEQAAVMAVVFGGMFIFIMILAVICYVYMAVCLMFLAKKTNVANGWWAWVPILNIFLMLKVAGKEWWWILLFFVPLVNMVIGIVLWMAIAERVGKPSWVGVLIILPLVGQFVPAYLAFSKFEKKVETPVVPTATV